LFYPSWHSGFVLSLFGTEDSAGQSWEIKPNAETTKKQLPAAEMLPNPSSYTEHGKQGRQSNLLNIKCNRAGFFFPSQPKRVAYRTSQSRKNTPMTNPVKIRATIE